MGLLGEFKEFVQRGNVVDMAVGVIIGAAFGKIVNSIVADLMMPPLGLATGGIDFKAMKAVIGGTPEAPVAINYGVFIQNVIDFTIIAFCVFLLVKAVNRMRRPAPAPPPAEPPEDVKLLTEIRDLLKRS